MPLVKHEAIRQIRETDETALIISTLTLLNPHTFYAWYALLHPQMPTFFRDE